MNDGALYATCFGWPESGRFTITTISSENLVSKDGIKSISMLGSDESLKWQESPNVLEVTFPKLKPCDYAYVLKIDPLEKENLAGDINYAAKIKKLLIKLKELQAETGDKLSFP